jgi:L-aspartate oxidase
MCKSQYDYIIIGCGLAGLYSALNASKIGTVALITKTSLEISNSYKAQGGIAAAMDRDDSAKFHFDDTIVAGRDLCNQSAVKILVTEGRDRIKELINLGMPFDLENDFLALGLEGGHSKRRVLHAGGDATGKEVVDFLLELVLKNKQIKIFENCFVHQLLINENECFGIAAYDVEKKQNFSLTGNTTIIASGGGSAIYSRSTNPSTSVGDGISLAFNAGVEIESMEFIQFHPTSFYSETGETFLISEAVRGEGAYLVNYKNEKFLKRFGITELSPRDQVAEAIFNEMNETGQPNVFLKLDHLNPKKIKSRFSTIYSEAKKFGIDIIKDPVPVAPAAHYMIGGIKTGLNAETNIKRLFAVGECASSGIHGANRLASNSLLECLVFSKRAVDFSSDNFLNTQPASFHPTDLSVDENLESSFLDAKDKTAKLLWENAGIIRSKEKLDFALKEINEIESGFPLQENEFYSQEIKSLLLISRLIVEAALIRKESRGCHLRKDFQQENSEMFCTIVQRKNSETIFSPIIQSIWQ